MMSISDTKMRELKSLSQQLKPVILLGANGLTENVHLEIERALYDHELIKIKLNSKEKTEKAALATAICDYHQATLVTQIGHVITIYKPSDKQNHAQNER